MSEIPADVMTAAKRAWALTTSSRPSDIIDIANAILAERVRCISVVIDTANAGKYTPLSELVAAIRGDQ